MVCFRQVKRTAYEFPIGFRISIYHKIRPGYAFNRFICDYNMLELRKEFIKRGRVEGSDVFVIRISIGEERDVWYHGIIARLRVKPINKGTVFR